MAIDEVIDWLSVIYERMNSKDTHIRVNDIPMECIDVAIETLSSLQSRREKKEIVTDILCKYYRLCNGRGMCYGQKCAPYTQCDGNENRCEA